MTNADLQKAFDAGYAAAKALYSILQKGGIEVTEADIRRIVEEVLEETLGFKTEMEVVLSGTFMADAGGGMIGDVNGDGIVDSFPLVVGKRYVVTFDGAAYECICEKFPDEDSISYIGNHEVLSEGVTDGEAPFVFMYGSLIGEGLFFATADKELTQHTIEVAAATIDPIDDNCLPGACLPVVELETRIDMDGEQIRAELSDADCQKLDGVVATKSPIIITMDIGGFVKCSAVYSYADVMGMNVYGGVVGVGEGVYKPQVFKNGDSWMVAVIMG